MHYNTIACLKLKSHYCDVRLISLILLCIKGIKINFFVCFCYCFCILYSNNKRYGKLFAFNQLAIVGCNLVGSMKEITASMEKSKNKI